MNKQRILHNIDLHLPKPGFEEFISSWILEVNNAVHVIDPGPASSLPILFAALGSRVPDYVLLTHIHVDHAGGIGQFMQAYPQAKILVAENARKHLVHPEKLIEGSVRTLGKDMMDMYGPILPVHESSILKDVPSHIRVIPTPGHAAHHISFLLEDMLFCGEALGVRYGSSHYIRPATPVRFDKEAYTSSIERLKFFTQGKLCFAHFGSMAASPAIYDTALEQIQLWMDIVTGYASPREILSPQEEDEILARLLAKDSRIQEFPNFPTGIQEREKIFMKNSIRGIWEMPFYSRLIFIFTVFCLGLLSPLPAHAYIGPGAGFAFLGSAFVFLITIALALVTLLFWPLQWLFRKVRGFGISRKARHRRVIIVGLDGLEPKLTEQYMAAGDMPNLKKLAEDGSYSRLGTTLPALSPVAWSTFQTGVNPGAHNIFDFLTRDKRLYIPRMASTEVEDHSRVIRILGIPLTIGKPKVVITRKSQPFWKILGKRGIFSNIIRVPISYPPEKFYGNILSAMCTPDIKGTQGSFTFYTNDKARVAGEQTGGRICLFRDEQGILKGEIDGPPLPKKEKGKTRYMQCQFSLRKQDANHALLHVGDAQVLLTLNEFSNWVEIPFAAKGSKPVSGIARFCLRELAEHISLYISPVNVNPEKPVLPIASPIFFASWLARKLGFFGTLGLMEDTWGRNELVIDDTRFLEQSYLTHEERERMFFEALQKTREGLCVCVFDASDRIQHMFWRYMDEKHPSPREEDKPEMYKVIPRMYERMDELVGKIRAKLKPEDLFIVLSDHGFASFRRGINLNTWLHEQGLLVLKGGVTTGADYLKDVDWSKTKAFALGLSGIYINRKGREREGIVEESEIASLKSQICKGLEALRDPQDASVCVSKMYDTTKEYKGLYACEAPDLIVGYAPGYRVSWDSVTGIVEPEVFSDNLKAWSGDHHIDPALVPGVLFTNVPLKAQNPHIADLAPSVLDVFGVAKPAYMEGKHIL